MKVGWIYRQRLEGRSLSLRSGEGRGAGEYK
jgi:hypothetical protein